MIDRTLTLQQLKDMRQELNDVILALELSDEDAAIKRPRTWGNFPLLSPSRSGSINSSEKRGRR